MVNFVPNFVWFFFISLFTAGYGYQNDGQIVPELKKSSIDYERHLAAINWRYLTPVAPPPAICLSIERQKSQKRPPQLGRFKVSFYVINYITFFTWLPVGWLWPRFPLFALTPASRISAAAAAAPTTATASPSVLATVPPVPICVLIITSFI